MGVVRDHLLATCIHSINVQSFDCLFDQCTIIKCIPLAHHDEAFPSNVHSHVYVCHTHV